MKKESQKDWGKFRDSLETDETVSKAEELFDEEDELIQPKDESQSASLEHPDYAELEQKLTLAEQKAHEHWEQSVRLTAELNNVVRRKDREIENAHRYGLEKFAQALIPVADSLEQALQLTTQHGDTAMREGLELTMKLFLEVLQKNGITQLDPIGEVFNPQWHEAMSMQPAPEFQPNTVSMVLQKGYLINERVIRPARVIVAK